jgi:hypothetical protein
MPIHEKDCIDSLPYNNIDAGTAIPHFTLHFVSKAPKITSFFERDEYSQLSFH